jgi:DNA-binding GntR family transcriptional regulator
LHNSSAHQQSDDLVEFAYGWILAYLIADSSIGSERLSVSSLARELGVSRTPVSMALMRLETEGLLRRNTSEGWVTVSPTLEDIEEIFEIKELLEPCIARKAAELLTPVEAQALLSAVREMEEMAELGDKRRWLAMDRRYHELLFDVAGNKRMKRLLIQYSNQIRSLQQLNVLFQDRMATACTTHRRMAEAIVAGDSDLAAQLSAEDVRGLRVSMTRLLKDVVTSRVGQRRL